MAVHHDLQAALCSHCSCVQSGGAPTLAGTSMFTVSKCTHGMKCEVMGAREWGHIWLIG